MFIKVGSIERWQEYPYRTNTMFQKKKKTTCTTSSLSSHQSKGTSGCFHILATTEDKAAMNIRVHRSLTNKYFQMFWVDTQRGIFTELQSIPFLRSYNHKSILSKRNNVCDWSKDKCIPSSTWASLPLDGGYT